MGKNINVGYVATWGKEEQRNALEVLNSCVFYIRHIGVEHGEWTLITCLFAHQEQGQIPVTMDHMTAYLNCSVQNVNKMVSSLRDKGHIIASKKKVDGVNIWTYDCSPILERIKKLDKEQVAVKFPKFVTSKVAEQLELDLVAAI